MAVSSNCGCENRWSCLLTGKGQYSQKYVLFSEIRSVAVDWLQPLNRLMTAAEAQLAARSSFLTGSSVFAWKHFSGVTITAIPLHSVFF